MASQVAVGRPSVDASGCVAFTGEHPTCTTLSGDATDDDGKTYSDGITASPAIALKFLSLRQEPRSGSLPSMSGPDLVDVLQVRLLDGRIESRVGCLKDNTAVGNLLNLDSGSKM